MCKIIEDMREEAREQGKIESKIEGALSTLIDLVKKGLLTPAQAAEQTDMTVDEFKKILGLNA